MRALAFILLGAAAFDAPLPWLDRVGVAALGLAVFALANTFRLTRAPQPAPSEPLPAFDPAPEDTDGSLPSLIERLSPYSARGE